jgi:hypothetical protein
MLDELAAQLAIRTRAASLVVATTGSTTLQATADGYARASGSFVTDGFRVGQDVTPTGFPQTDVGVITAVSALFLMVSGGRTVAAPASGRTLVSGLPTMRAYELVSFTPIVGRPYVTEEWVPGAAAVSTFPSKTGRMQEEFLSIWTWFGVAGVGVGAIRKGVDAFKRLFAGATDIAVGDGTYLRVRTDATVKSGQVIPLESGFAYCQITVPLRAHTRNAVMA